MNRKRDRAGSLVGSGGPGSPRPQEPSRGFHIQLSTGFQGLTAEKAFMEAVTAYTLANRRRFRIVFSKLIPPPLQFCQDHILSRLLFMYVI